MIRRRNEWSKWIPASAQTISPKETTHAQPVEAGADSYGNKDLKGENTKHWVDENVQCVPSTGNSLEHIPATWSSSEAAHISVDNSSEPVQCDGEKIPYFAENGDGRTSISESDVKTNYNKSYQDQSHEAESASFVDRFANNSERSPSTDVPNHNDVSNDFANTFMLDEELEIEQKAIKKDDLPTDRRYIFQFP